MAAPARGFNSPRSQSPPRPQPESQKPPVDGRTYYGYLFHPDKAPTDTLDALLRAIGLYIIDNIGDKDERQLTAPKLSAFYHAVGGNYDALFLNTPQRSLSYIWRALGVQHSLQPTDNDYESPSVPALTLRGFVRWESLQILLGPEEHVPFLQYAVANWKLKHPATGEPFPPDLSADSFPNACDMEVDKWHKECGRRLRDAALEDQKAKADEEPPRSGKPEMPDHSQRTTYIHQPRSAPTVPPLHHRSEFSDYFPRRRPLSYVHVSGPRHSEQPSRPPVTTWHRPSKGSAEPSPDELPRRRSHSDFQSPLNEEVRPSAHHDPRPPNARRHSYVSPGIASASDSDTDSDIPPPRAPRPRQGSPDRLSHRRGPPPPYTQAIPPHRLRHPETRLDDAPKSGLGLKQKFANLLSSSGDRQRSSSRERRPPAVRSTVYRKEPSRRLRDRSDSKLSYTSDDSDLEITPKYTPPSSREGIHARERERERERAIDRQRERERDRIRELEEETRKERSYLRPSATRRASSHADIDRRPREFMWDSRDRDAGGHNSKDLEREVRRNLTGDEMERDRRERRRRKERGPSPGPVMATGVSGRRYPR